ncbi:MAG: cation diffusion facilitator family transporter [Bacilli bacterium]|jgi:cation diffusion facilitator family transporter|nr:cation diffusion facilitator family transporter [Bacilli bacterium]
MTRYESTKKVGFYGIIGNIFLLIIKFSVAFISHSQALIADAINSAGDIFSSLMTYIGNKIACTPSDDNHNFGHGKAEYIFSMLISVFMLFIASKILLDSVVSIITKKEFIFSYYLILVCIITILVKLTLYLYCKKLYKKHSNILINASMKDHRNDILLTMGTLTSIILGSFGYYFFDGIFGAVISIYIMLSGIGIFLESYKILMDVSLDSNDKEEIIKYIKSQKEIKKISDFHTVATGYKYIAIVTIYVDGSLSTFKSHEIADNLEQEIPKKYRKIYRVIVHVNPI